MQRRDILKAACVLPAMLGTVRAHAAPGRMPGAADLGAGWRQYVIATEVRLAGTGPATLWLPVAQSAGDYQKSLGVSWQGDARDTALVRDPVYGAAILRADWSANRDDRTRRTLRMVQKVAVRDRGPRGARAGIAEQQLYLRPTPDMPLDGIVEATSDRIVRGHATPDAKLRAIYDWVVENCFRDPKTPGCGLGRIQRILETRAFGGKCADQSSLLVGLARAAGLPAREVYGIRVDRSAQFPSLGAAGDITGAQHCRAEVYLPSHGWMPVDPADVRKAALAEKLPLRDPALAAFRERAFGNWEMNWVGFNSARDFRLPGGTGTAEFLMYPAARETRILGDGARDWLQPEQSGYAISSRRI